MAAQEETRIIRELKVREYEDKDKDQIIDLWIDAGLFEPHQRALAENELHVAYHVPNGRVLIGELNGEAVASVYIAATGLTAWIWDLAVRPDLQGMHYGEVMLNRAEKWIKDQGIRRVMLLVLPQNEKVIGFYEREEYEKLEHIVMAKTL